MLDREKQDKKMWARLLAEHPKPKELKEGSVYWVPCAGRWRPSIPEGHVGKIEIAQRQGKSGPVVRKSTSRWITLDQARIEFGKDLIASPSSASCPSCTKLIRGSD